MNLKYHCFDQMEQFTAAGKTVCGMIWKIKNLLLSMVVVQSWIGDVFLKMCWKY